MYRLMLVDDEPAILNALKRVIYNQSNMTVRYYSDPEKAWSDLRSYAPHMVISDYRMRPIDGLELLTKAAEVVPDSVRILFTAYADKDVVVNAVNVAGVSRIVLKPWNNHELLAVIREARSSQQLRLNDRRLAWEYWNSQTRLSAEKAALCELELSNPGLTQVERDERGYIILSENDTGENALDSD